MKIHSLLCAFFACFFVYTGVVADGSLASVLTYHNDNYRTGLNTNEAILSPLNVNSANFGKLFTYNLDGLVFAQPLYVSGMVIPGQGIHNVLYVATEHNSVYALEADSNNAFTNGVIWKVNLGPAQSLPRMLSATGITEDSIPTLLRKWASRGHRSSMQREAHFLWMRLRANPPGISIAFMR